MLIQHLEELRQRAMEHTDGADLTITRDDLLALVTIAERVMDIPERTITLPMLPLDCVAISGTTMWKLREAVQAFRESDT